MKGHWVRRICDFVKKTFRLLTISLRPFCLLTISSIDNFAKDVKNSTNNGDGKFSLHFLTMAIVSVNPASHQFNMCFLDAQKNHLIERVLLSTYNMFWLRKKEIFSVTHSYLGACRN